MLNALTIDVEDYWSILYRDWLYIKNAIPSEAVVRNTRWFLQVLAKYNAKATFFILGEVAQHFPQLIKEISQAGHEIGVHGFYHRQIFKLSQEEFKKEVETARRLLEDISGQEVIGHRAPAFSINENTKWALEVLAQCGFVYDSSISPMQGRRYGWPEFKKEIHKMKLPNGQSIIEVPMSTVSLGVKELGVGGGYLRHFPYIYTKLAIRHIQKKRPVIVYMHPHEIDLEDKCFSVGTLDTKQKFKLLRQHKLQFRNRETMKKKIFKLLSDFNFTTIKSLLNENF